MGKELIFEFWEQLNDDTDPKGYSVWIEYDVRREIYGEDADGNRGQVVFYTDIDVLNILDNGKDITKEFRKDKKLWNKLLGHADWLISDRITDEL